MDHERAWDGSNELTDRFQQDLPGAMPFNSKTHRRRFHQLRIRELNGPYRDW
ncbi:hypothetical protein ASPVEDRAFT_44033 [Aspergillus versicolor CBS 583.65]|uniref:Uncharacterized protein n=1 Tax=Aspergillus versicolor CBS 583.65 TaxID=1036611 RepID=A0A1L9PSW6_ASPVE|nr:uncharacterized protein ASPVEDRAFT_44033 [Aspergillus versicolor CBS 583.65]OJJ04536.1 hypothetical protein ASPVEDRAFT_44033 [Aspergillus versicolor CBS 583.65]